MFCINSDGNYVVAQHTPEDVAVPSVPTVEERIDALESAVLEIIGEEADV